MKENEEILNGQIGGTLETTKSEQLVEIERIHGTPFTLVKKEDKYFIALANYRVTEEYTDKEQLLDKLYDLEWDFLISVMTVIIDMDKGHTT